MFSIKRLLASREDPSPVSYREEVQNGKFLSNTPGSLISSPRKFGVEIECRPPSTDAINVVAHKMGQELGIGSDSGVEWKTPILQGNLGENYIEALCALLKQKEFTVNSGNGLHIHLDGGNNFLEKNALTLGSERTRNLARLLMIYTAFEDVIQSFVAPSRRQASWCQPLRQQFSYHFLENVQTQNEIEQVWYRTKDLNKIAYGKSSMKGGQRPGINFSSFFYENHVEIRYHSGTINARKILEWVNLHQKIMDIAPMYSSMTYHRLAPYFTASLKEKTKMLFDLLELPVASQQYFLARQDRFERKVELPAYTKEHEDILVSDNEVLV